MKVVTIKTEYITLGQFLKLTNIISSGSDAKWFLREHQVLVNDQVDERRGRKLYNDDVVTIGKEQYQVKNS